MQHTFIQPGWKLLRACAIAYALCASSSASAVAGAITDAIGEHRVAENAASPLSDYRPDDGSRAGTTPSPGEAPNPESEPGPSEGTNRYLTRSRSSVYFARGSAELNGEALATISENAERLKAHPAAAVTLVGFTEDLASSAYSLALAQQRTKVVGDALLNMGVAARQIRSTAYGQEDPGTAPCATEVCRVSYRRVEFRYLKPEDAMTAADPAKPSRGRAQRRRD